MYKKFATTLAQGGQEPNRSQLKGSKDGDPSQSTQKGSEEVDPSQSTQKGSDEVNPSQSTQKGSEEVDPSQSIQKGSEGVYDYYCQPCNVDDYQVEATFYCNNCQKYLCKKCSTSHKNSEQRSDHDILDIQHMTNKQPVKEPAPIKAFTMAIYTKDIKVQGNISSCAFMSTNQLLVFIYTNLDSKVILVDTDLGKEVSHMTLPGKSWQVTRISDTEAAVTIPEDKKILLLKVITCKWIPGHRSKERLLSEISLQREISVHEKCYGIAYTENRLIVTFKEGHVDMLDMSGNVLYSISADQTGKKIFTWPCFVTVDPATGSMYVSDWVSLEAGRLVKLSKEGSVEATYSSDTGGAPLQVALDTEDMLYVAWINKPRNPEGSVDQLDVNCDLVRTLISGLSYPRAPSYDEHTQQLFVAQQNGAVKVFGLMLSSNVLKEGLRVHFSAAAGVLKK